VDLEVGYNQAGVRAMVSHAAEEGR
jgi:hypothetical protein